MSRREAIVLSAIAALSALAIALRFAASPDGLRWPVDDFEFDLRALRIACALTVGAALAISGVMLQALLRNPLAEPAVLGLTTGAGLGVVVSIFIAYSATGSILLYAPPALPALIGALGALAIVGALGQRRGLIDPVSLILVGVVLSLICGAGIVFVQHLLPDRGVAMATRWVTGSISDETPWRRIVAVAAATLVAGSLATTFSRALDAAALSDDEARSVGVPLGLVRAALFIGSGALTAGAVLIAGPIGFVGLVAPHAVRRLSGPRHRSLVPASALLGGALIVLADAGVRLIDLGAGRMPIGAITAILGGPAFLWLLRRERLQP
ncbi:MAG: iron ABC transporter permease [Phycisphaerales bacterium]|nr:iron ABC transporter permease [Phycisphaerales bacterium]